MDYTMYTQEGNELVDKIVQQAKSDSWSWKKTYAAMLQLSQEQPDMAGEATDTAVREVVYNAIRAYERDEDFYV